MFKRKTAWNLKALLLTLALGTVPFALTGCEEAEDLGHDVEDAVEDTSDEASDALDSAADATEDAAENVADEAEDTFN